MSLEVGYSTTKTWHLQPLDRLDERDVCSTVEAVFLDGSSNDGAPLFFAAIWEHPYYFRCHIGLVWQHPGADT